MSSSAVIEPFRRSEPEEAEEDIVTSLLLLLDMSDEEFVAFAAAVLRFESS